jgi:hypothetical protein
VGQVTGHEQRRYWDVEKISVGGDGKAVSPTPQTQNQVKGEANPLEVLGEGSLSLESRLMDL